MLHVFQGGSTLFIEFTFSPVPTFIGNDDKSVAEKGLGQLDCISFYCRDCLRCPLHLNSIGWATLPDWSAIKKYKLRRHSQGEYDYCSISLSPVH